MGSFIFPRFTDDKQFESLVRDIFRKRTGNINFQIFGRNGQKQYGIDSYGMDYTMNEFIVVQCKNFTKVKSTNSAIKELNKALALFDKKGLSFYHKVKRFYFVTALDEDTDFAEYAELINSARTEQGLVEVVIVSWDELMDDMSSYQELLYKYYTNTLPSNKQENIFIKTQQTETYSVESTDDIISKKDEIIMSIKTKLDFDPLLSGNEDNKYSLTLGLWGFGDKPSFDSRVDIDINFSSYFNDTDFKWESVELFFTNLGRSISEMKTEINLNQIIILTHLQPSIALLAGKILQGSSSGIEFIFQINSGANQIILSSNKHGLVHVSPNIHEEKIFHSTEGSKNDIVFLFNSTQPSIGIDFILKKPIFRDINPSWGFGLLGDTILSTSHGYSQAEYLIGKIQDISNYYKDSSGVLNIHIVLICPEQFAFLVGVLLRTVNANLNLYYQSEDKLDYVLAGVLPN